MHKKLFDYVRKNCLSKANEAEKELVEKIISILLKMHLLRINHEELQRVIKPPAKAKPLSPEAIATLMGMVMRMLKLELDDLNDQKGKQKLKGEQTLDFGEAICSDFKIPKRNHGQIKRICLAEGWEVKEIEGMTVKVMRAKK